MIDSLLCNLRDMNHALLARCELQECAELLNADYLAGEHHALFKIGYDDLNQLHSLVHIGLVRTTYGYGAVIININLHTGLLDNGIDGLTSLTNHIANLLGIDLNLNNLRCIRSDLSSGLCNAGLHTGIHNEHSCFPASCNGSLHNGTCQAVNLNIHLNSRNTLGGSCYLEVHVSEEVLKALNIRQKYIVIIRLTGH